MKRHLFALLLLLAPGCATHEEGLTPVGSATESLSAQKRYLRRLWLDLAGAPPGAGAEADALGRLGRDGDTATTRGAIADGLLSQPAFAKGLVAEMESRLFTGSSRSDTYNLLCAFYRNADPACQTCALPTTADVCAGCACPRVQALVVERAQLDAAAGDLTAQATTVEIERRYAGADAYRLRFASADTLAQTLFGDFLGRAPSAAEQRNAAAMDIGSLLGPTYPAGSLFHRYGRSYKDLIDIVFSSEVYQDALVNRVFQRYLGRDATARERAHFVAQLDPQRPDARALIRAVVSSREYFIQ